MTADLNAALARLRERAAVWFNLPIAEKIDVFQTCRDRVARSAERWTAIAAKIKGVDATEAAGEEALSGPWGTIRALDAYIRTLRRLERGRPPIPPHRVRSRGDGLAAVRVFPNTLFDRCLLPGVRADVWLEPAETIGGRSILHNGCGSIIAVMGAGNVTSIGALDVLSKLFGDNAVCIFKIHPLLKPLLPVIDEIFAPLIEKGFVATTCGGAREGAYLCGHPLIDAVHLTGNMVTYRAIAAETAKPLTAELGNVTPAIVMGGRWSDRELQYVAESLASAKLHNNGYDCIALQVLVLPTRWPQRADLVAAIERVMRGVPERPAYYPGSVMRFEELIRGRSSFRGLGPPLNDAYIPPAIVEVDCCDPYEPLFTREAFCPLLAIATIDGDPAQYLGDAVRFCNERLAGDLAAHIVARPTTLREHAALIDGAVEQLRYGLVGVNLWCGVAFLLPELPWGAAPGNTVTQIGSGIGTVHNAFNLSHAQKSVLRGPFCPLSGRDRPPWFVTQRNARAIAASLCDYERRSSPVTLSRLAWLTLTG